MRSLRSGRTVATESLQKENVAIKKKKVDAKSKVSKTQKTLPERQVLADKTNSSPDRSAIREKEERRPKRQRNPPGWMKDHLQSVRSSSSPITSTPKPVKQKVVPVEPEKPLESDVSSSPKETTEAPATRKRNRKDANSICQSVKTLLSPKGVAKSPKKSPVKLEPPPVFKAPANVRRDPIYSKFSSPVFKKKVDSKKIEDSKRIYDFALAHEIKVQSKPKRRLKKTTDGAIPKSRKNNKAKFDEEAAMKGLMEQVKRIREAAKLKKLKTAINQKKQEIGKEPIRESTVVRVEIHDPPPRRELVPPELPRERSYSPMPSPIRDDDEPYGEAAAPPTVSLRLPKPFDDSKSLNSFTDLPIASSSMIHQDRRPAGSPWRVTYETRDRRWPYNFPVKASMTPSYQRDTFHVLGLDDKPTDPVDSPKRLPVISKEREKKIQQLKQTTILSLYEGSINKQKRLHSPKKQQKIPEFDLEELIQENKAKEQAERDEAQKLETISEKETEILSPVKEQQKNKPKATIEDYFGFDDSFEDQENIEPAKISKQIQNINTVKRAVLKSAILKESNVPLEVPDKAVVKISTRKTTRKLKKQAATKQAVQKTVTVEVVNDESSEDDQVPLIEPNTETSSPNLAEPPTISNVPLFEDPVEPVTFDFVKVSIILWYKDVTSFFFKCTKKNNHIFVCVQI
jgi:hypothetical protein